MNWRYRHTVLSLCLLAFFVTFFARLAISPVVPFIITDFEITNTAIGVALSGMWLAYGLAQFPSGVLADRYGERRIILIAIAGTTVMSVVLAVAPVFPVFVLAAFLLGLVAGLHYAVATTLLTRTFEDVGTALGLHSTGGPLAGLIAPIAAAWVGLRWGWRPAVALSALVGLPIFVLFYTRVKPTEPRQPDDPVTSDLQLGQLAELILRPEILFSLSIAMLGTYIVQGVMSFLPTFLVDFRAYSPAIAGAIFSAFFIVRMSGQVVIGRLSDSLGRDIALGAAMLSGAVGLTVFIVSSSLFGSAIGVLFAGFGSSFFAAIDPRFMDILGEAERGTGFGLVRTIYTVIGAAGSVGVGLVADLFGWGASFGVLAALFGLAFLILVANKLLNTGY